MFKWSKTLQLGGRTHTVPLVEIPESVVCPVRTLNNICLFFPLPEDKPLFRIRNTKGEVPMTYSWYNDKLKSLISATGRNGQFYSSHSARRGGTTFLSQCGIPRETIMAIGDWSLDAVDILQHLLPRLFGPPK